MALIDQVKRKLNITWSDEETDGRVADVMDSVSPVLKHRLGITDPKFDFSQAGQENILFLNLCLYEWNHSANEFWTNYADDVATCQAVHEVAYYQAKEGDSDAETP